MMPNTIFVPASGSFVVNIEEETDDGYVCSYMTNKSKIFILKEHVFRNVNGHAPWRWNNDIDALEQDPIPEFAIEHAGHIEDWKWSR